MLAQINSELANDIANTTAEAIKNALTGITLNFNKEQLDDIAKGVRAPSTVAEPKALGGLIYAAAGTMVDFKSQGTDTVPAMLTPGEFVVNRTATANNLGLLHSINSGKTSYYADGGYVSNIEKDDFKKSDTKASKNMYPDIGNVGSTTSPFQAYNNVQALPSFSGKTRQDLSKLSKGNVYSYIKGTSILLEPSSYILGGAQPPAIMAELGPIIGATSGQLYRGGAVTTPPPSIGRSSFSNYIDAQSADADKISSDKKFRIEGDDEFATYRDKLLALNTKVPRSLVPSDDSFDIDGQTIYYPSQNNIDKYGRGLVPTATVVDGGYYSRLILKNLAGNIDSGTSFGPFFARKLEIDNNQKVSDYYVEGNLWKSLVASSISNTKSKQSSFSKYLGMDPIEITNTAAKDLSPESSKDYIKKLALITERVREAIKNIDKDSATHETDKNMKVIEFSNKLASLYNGTERAQVFNKSDLLKIDEFTSADTMTVYGTSFSNWNDKYVKDIENSIAHTDKFRDLEYFKEGAGGKDPVEISPDGAAGGIVKKFGWVGGGDFEFSESAQKAMNAEVQQNKDKIGGIGSSQPPSKGNVLLTASNVNLPYNLSYLEYSNSAEIAGVAGAAAIAANEKVYWVQSPEDDLSVFKNLKEISSKLFVKQDGMKKNLPIDQVAAELNRDKPVNDYFDALKKYGINDSRTVALEAGINDKTVKITGEFLKPRTPGDITNFKEAYGGSATIRIGDYLKASAKAISSKLTKDSKAQANKKMKNSTNDAESLEDKQYPGASLAMILGAQSLFSSGGQFELPDILGSGWFHPTLDSQYKSIYDVDPGTLRAYMGNLSQVIDNKVQRMNQVMSRIPDSYRDQAVAGLTNLYGAKKAFEAISTGDTSSLMGLFGKADFQNQTPQGDPAMNRKAVELFQSLGMATRMGSIGTEQFTKDQKRQTEKDLKGVKINKTGSSTNKTEDISPEELPTTYQQLFDLAINPYNEFPKRDSRKELIQQFIDAVPTARDPGTNSLLFGPQTGAMFGDALTNLQKWYGGGQGTTWLGSDYLTEQGTVDVTDPFSHEPKSYDTRLTELEAVRNDNLYQDASAGYIHIGGKQKFNTDLPDFDYYKNKAPLYKQTGGMIYASQGTLVNFQPRGTDTIPAMLTPGEFVINRQATQEHLPLLQAINDGGIKGFSGGGVVYLAGGGMAQRQTKDERRAQFQERKQARDQQLAQAKEQRSEYGRQRKAGLETQREAMGYRNRLLREGRSVDEANQMAKKYAQEEFQNNYQQIKDQERAKFEELEQRKAEIQEDKARAIDPVLKTQDLLARYEGRLTELETARAEDTVKGPYPELNTDATSDKTSIAKGSRYANRPSGDRFRDSLSDKDKAVLDQALRQKNNERISKERDEQAATQSAETDKKAQNQAETEAKTAANIDTARTGRSFSLTENTGKRRNITGTVISRNDQGVSFKKDDGKVVFVPFNRLNTDSIMAVNAQWGRVEAQRNKEMEEASRSNFANMAFMAKEQERSKKLQEAGIKDASTETDILRRKRDSGINITKDETATIEKEDKDRDHLVRSRAKAASAMKEEEESTKRKATIAEGKARLERRDAVYYETREKLAGIVKQELATIEQLKKEKKESGWFGALSRGVIGVDETQLQIQAAENKLASARLGLDSLGDTSATESRRGGHYAGGPSSATEFNRGSDYDPGRALDTARGLAGLPHVDSTSYKPKDTEPVTNRGLYNPDFADTSEKSSTKTITSSKNKNILGIDTTSTGIGFNTTYTTQNSLDKAKQDSLTATRDIAIDAITGVAGFGVGSAGFQAGKVGAKTALQRAATIGLPLIPGAIAGGVKGVDDVRSGKKTTTQAVVDTGIQSLVGALAMGGGSALSAGARKIANKAGDRLVAKVSNTSGGAEKIQALVSKGYHPHDAASMVSEAAEDAAGDEGARKLAAWLGIKPNAPPPTSQSLGQLGTPTWHGTRIVGSALPDAVVPGTPQITLPVTPSAPITNFTKPAVPSTWNGASPPTSPGVYNLSHKQYDDLLNNTAQQLDPKLVISSTVASQSAAAAAPSVTAATNVVATTATKANSATGNLWSRNMPFADSVAKGTFSIGRKLYGKGKEKIGGYLKNAAIGSAGIGGGIAGTKAVMDTAMGFFSEEKPQRKASGGIVYASNGALIEAKQFGSDSVPAMLTPGEFVVNSQSAQRFMPVLNAINSGHYSHGGAVKYLANGGMVQPKYLADAGMVNNNITNMSSQSGVLTSTSANQSQPVMAKPAWVDEFASRLEQGGAIFNQGASRVVEGANTISSAGQDIANAKPTLTLGGNVDIANPRKIVEESLAGMMPIAQSAGQMGREGARQDSKKQWMNRTGDA